MATREAMAEIQGKTDNDQQLAQLLVQLQEVPLPGQAQALDAACRQHPELAAELRQLLAVGQIVAGLASSSQDQDPGATIFQPLGKPAQAPGALPRRFAGYDLLEELGRGGMGVVYKAWDPALQRLVAIKMILDGRHASPNDLARFRMEAQAAASLEHPNIVPVHQVGEFEGQAYFCMKYVPGQSLAVRVAAGPLPPPEAARIVALVARAIHHAHEKGILHRDLKPANILLSGEGPGGQKSSSESLAPRQGLATLPPVPLVTDFGLAKRIEEDALLTGTGAILGTPSYMAPEQSLGGLARPGPAADIYALGAILYELLTGRPPFLAATVVETILLVRSEELVRPRSLNPQIDLDLEFICRKCLEKRPEHRYASALDLALDLDAYLHGEPVSARSSSLVYFINRLFRETHHALVLENWGLLWIMQSAMIMLLCAVTTALHASGVDRHWPFLALWSFGLVIWAWIFWNLRRRLGPVTFVERQIAHAWAAGVVASIGVFWVEVFLDLPVLTLTPVLAIAAAMVFLVKAGTLSGWFYVAAAFTFVAALPMVVVGPTWGPLIFGAVSSVGFLVPGIKYFRLRLRDSKTRIPTPFTSP